MVMGIERLLDDPVLYAASAAEARRRAEQRWARDAIIDRVEAVLTGMAETRARKFT